MLPCMFPNEWNIHFRIKMHIYQPFNTRQTGVSSLPPRWPGDRSGRHVVGAQPGRGSFGSIELEDRNKATSQRTSRTVWGVRLFGTSWWRAETLEPWSLINQCWKYVCRIWNIQAFSTHFEAFLFQLVCCGQEIGSERLLEGKQTDLWKTKWCDI